MQSSTLNTDTVNTNWGREGQAGYFAHSEIPVQEF